MKYTVKYFLFILFTGLFIISCGTKKPDASKEKAASDSASSSNASTPIDQLTQQIKTEPNKPELYARRSQFYLAEKKFTPAMNDINKALSLDSTNSSYYIILANIHFATMNIPKSEEAFQKAIAVDSKNIEAYLKLAELYLYLKKYDESIKNADEALKIDVHRAKTYFIKGFAFTEIHDTARAISSFQTCVEQEPEYYDAFIQLGILFEAKRNPLAVEYYNRALKLRPNSTEALYDRGKFFQDNGELDKAIDDYNSIIKIDPGYKDAYFNLGYIEVNSNKNYKKAIEYFTKAIERDKYYAAAFYNRGYCYEMTGDKQNARRDYLSALGIDQTYILPKNGMKRLGSS